MTVAPESMVNTRPPDTTGVAVMRCLRLSPFPIEADHASCGAAPSAGWLTRVLGVPGLCDQLAFVVAAGSEIARVVLAGTGASAGAAKPSLPCRTDRTSSRTPGRITSGSAQADSSSDATTAPIPSEARRVDVGFKEMLWRMVMALLALLFKSVSPEGFRQD